MIKIAEQPSTIHLKDYIVPDYLIDTVSLDFTLEPSKTHVVNTMRLKRNPQSQSEDAPLLLQGEQLTLIDVILNGKTLAKGDYQLKDGTLKIPGVPDAFELIVTNEIAPIDNKALSGLYISGGMFCTQCEPHGFRRITYYLDRPDILSIFTTTIRAPKNQFPVLLSNGNCTAKQDLADGWHMATWSDPFKKPAYLFALVAGDLTEIRDQYTTGSGRKVDIAFYTAEADANRCQHAIDSLKKAMAWDEQTYGLEYDLDIYMVVAVSDFNMGAMENKGLNIFNTKYVLADPLTATDRDYALVESVIGHEYFHNWSGNRVTCRDWFQLSLKEGLTVFREQQFAAWCNSPGVNRIDEAQLMQTRQFSEDGGPLSHPIQPKSYIEINNFYTLTVYEKGADVIRMMHTLLEDAGFKKGMKLYFERHDGQAATCEDFIAAMQDANEKDLTQFARWYHQAGTPELSVESTWSESQNAFQISIEQCTPISVNDETPKAPLHIPIRVELLSTEGEVLFEQAVLEMTEAQQTFKFDKIKSAPVLALLAGFSAPVKIKYDYDINSYGVLLNSASDPYVRWQAGQQLIQSTLTLLLNQKKKGRALLMDSEILSDFKGVANEQTQDLSLKARLLTLPTFRTVSEQLPRQSIDLLWDVYAYFSQFFARALEENWQSLYKTSFEKRSHNLDGSAKGHRHLANIALHHWMTADPDAAADVAWHQFDSAMNMTETMGALVAVNDSGHPVRRKMLDAFSARYSDNALAMDKWFAIQACSSADDTLQQVKDLCLHPLFSLKNPNRVYALLNTFSGNWRHFNEGSGAGYSLIADKILEIDPFNPQVSARLAQSFSQWRLLDPVLHPIVKEKLSLLLKEKSLSKDTFEIVQKIHG